jgi:hypothetical protein
MIMNRKSFVFIEGKPYRWSDLVQLRKEQLAARNKAEQLGFFTELPDDIRPRYERTASERYQQPSLFTL